MLNRLAFFSGSIACLVLLTGCGGGNSLITSPTKPADVYVAGYQSDASGKHTAIYWKNGIATTLPDNNQGSQAYAIAVSGTDVYVAGDVSNGAYSVATLWKNNSPVALTDGTNNAYARAVFVAGSDVYVAGYDGRGAEYWKNGVPVVLTDGSEQAASNAIFVLGSDVYAAGYEYQNTQISPTSSIVAPVATYWKNGTAVALANGSQPSVIWALFVSGSDVYASGYYQKDSSSAPTAAYWKNGALIPLTDATNTGARSIFVSGPDVYSVGDGNSVPQIAYYWKNATETPVSGAHQRAERISIRSSSPAEMSTLLAESREPTGFRWRLIGRTAPRFLLLTEPRTPSETASPSFLRPSEQAPNFLSSEKSLPGGKCIFFQLLAPRQKCILFLPTCYHKSRWKNYGKSRSASGFSCASKAL